MIVVGVSYDSYDVSCDWFVNDYHVFAKLFFEPGTAVCSSNNRMSENELCACDSILSGSRPTNITHLF